MSKGWEVWKDIAYPGRVVVPGTDGNLVYDFTPRDMQLLERTGNAKIKDSWNIPVTWEHQDVEPERLRMSRNADRDFARGVFGRLKKFARTPDGRLKALLAGDDPDDYRQLQKIGFVSPEIAWDWQDTEGRLWAGPSVTHLAATPRPVQRHQHPVGCDPDAPHSRLAQAGSLANLVRMSLTANSLHSRNGIPVGAKLRLSLDHYASPPGGSSMADDDKGKGDKKVPGMPDDGKKNPWMRIAEALERAGIKIGTGENVKDADHLADLIEVAAMNSDLAEEPDFEDLPPEDEDENENAPAEGDMDAPPEGTIEPPAPPVQMSQIAQQKLVAMHRKDLLRRAERLGSKGHVPPVVANELVGEVKRVRLSLTKSADLAESAVAAKILAYEKLPAGSAWSKDGRTPKDGDKDKNGKPVKKVKLSQRANGGRDNVRTVDNAPYREDGDQDEDSIIAAYERNVGRTGYDGQGNGNGE